MQTRRFVAVWLGVSLLAACSAPGDDFEQTEGVASGHVAAAAEPGVARAATLGELAQRAYLKASNTTVFGASFGYSVALSADGSTLAVGALGESSAATGVGGDQADSSAPGAGAVYVFRRRGKTWIQQAYLKASNTGAGDLFGHSVALSADGSTLAVGAPWEDSAATGINGDQADNSTGYAGAAYVFTRRGMKWSQEAYVKTATPGMFNYFGYSVALSSDGSTLAVSAPLDDSRATGIDGNPLDDTAEFSGAVYVFTRSGTAWSQQAYVKASNTGTYDSFGWSIALSSDGSTLAVGAYGERSATTGIDGDQGDDSAAYAGAVYVFTRSGATWSQQAYIKASNTNASDQLGFSIALSSDGSTLAAGAYLEDSAATGINGDQGNTGDGNGAVYVFARSGTAWSQQAYVKASNTDAGDLFGHAVALSGDGSTLAVGAILEDSAALGIGGDQADNSAGSAGAVYLFARNATTWSQAAYVKASNTDVGDYFGHAVALSADGSTLAAGAPYEASAATGIDGDQSNNSATSAGAVYVFDRRH